MDILHAGLLCFVDDQLYLVCGMHATVAKKFPTYVRCAVEKTHLPRERIMKANVFLDVDQNRIREFTNLLNMHYSDLDFDVAFTGFLWALPLPVARLVGCRESPGRQSRVRKMAAKLTTPRSCLPPARMTNAHPR